MDLLGWNEILIRFNKIKSKTYSFNFPLFFSSTLEQSLPLIRRRDGRELVTAVVRVHGNMAMMTMVV